MGQHYTAWTDAPQEPQGITPRLGLGQVGAISTPRSEGRGGVGSCYDLETLQAVWMGRPSTSNRDASGPQKPQGLNWGTNISLTPPPSLAESNLTWRTQEPVGVVHTAQTPETLS